jgi:signal transduction histidine kinase
MPCAPATPADPVSASPLRVLLLPPTRRDGEVTRELLRQAAVECVVCADPQDASEQVHQGVGALLLTEHALADRRMRALLDALAAQPAWSDIPVVLMLPDRTSAPFIHDILDQLTNLTLLDRPVSTRSMVSAVLAALRARRRQYQIRDELVARQQAEQALREADQRKDEFLATLAHELRNPLAPIRTGLHVLGEMPGDSPQAVRMRGVMQRQLLQLVRLVDELLDVSRISTGKVVLQRERLDLRAMVVTALEACQPAIENAGHDVRSTLPDHPVWVIGDETRLVQAIGNLVTNACKYTPDHGVISVTLQVAGGEAVLRITDNGVGIPPALLDNVFDLFTQVNRTLDRAQGGLGIGLSLVRRLLTLHGGSIEAASEGLDRGSTFTLRLPTASAEPPAPAAQAPLPPPPTARRRLRVLVVDDNRDAADALTLALNSSGHTTRTEYGGAAALAAAVEFEPEVVFCDIGMPGLDGHEVARRLSAMRQHRPMVLVAITGWGGEEDIRRTETAGFDHHLVKPVEPERLDAILARL